MISFAGNEHNDNCRSQEVQRFSIGDMRVGERSRVSDPMLTVLRVSKRRAESRQRPDDVE
jgi:hypothetical protein